MRIRRLLACLIIMCLLSLVLAPTALAWSNGDNSGNGYGGHDWILYEASRLAAQQGFSWVDMRQAQPMCDDPDTVLHDTYHHVYDVWGTTYGDAPTRIGELYDLAVDQRAAGDFTNASKTVGLLAHYYGDICNPLHTDQTSTEDGIHSAYETAAQTRTDGFGENRGWIGNDGLQYVPDVTAKAEAAATFSHGYYSALSYAYRDKYWGSSVEAITKTCINRAVNDLADIIASINADAELRAAAVTTDRWAGPGRYETAVELSRQNFSQVTTVVVATGEGWADALSGGPLAATYYAPLLLVRRDAVPGVVSDEISRLGATAIVVLGGPTAVSETVVQQLRALPTVNTVERIAGWNRYATAQAVAMRMRELDSDAMVTSCFLATGYNYADALGASGIASWLRMPILLTTPSALPTPTAAAIDAFTTLPDPSGAGNDAHGYGRVYVLGSSKVISDPLVVRLRDTVGVTRLYGSDRYATARAVTSFWYESTGQWLRRPVLVSGANFPDALAAGPALANQGRALLVTSPIRLASPTAASLSSAQPLESATFVGGENALSTFVNADLQRVFNPSAVAIPAYPVWSPPAPPPPPPAPYSQRATSVQCSISDSTPAQYSNVTASAKVLDQKGKPIKGATVTFTWKYKTVTHTETSSSAADGLASSTRNISGASKGYKVVISITAKYGGGTASGSTAFTPQ